MITGIKRVSYDEGVYNAMTEELLLPSLLVDKLKLTSVKLIKPTNSVYIIPYHKGYDIQDYKIRIPKQVLRFLLQDKLTGKTNLKFNYNKQTIKLCVK